MEHEQILAKTKNEELNVEQAFQELCEIGYCPNLLNDDDGRWAVVFDGMQSVVMGDEAEDVSTSFFVEAKQWHSNIRQALIIALSE